MDARRPGDPGPRRPSPLEFIREVVAEWSADNALSQGAALAYYTLFSLAPLLALVVIVAGLALGRAAAQGVVVDRITGVVGAEGARALQGMLTHVSEPRAGIVPTVLSLVTMVVGASGAFGQLQTSLNQIWGVKQPRHAGVRGAIVQRLLALAMIIGIGILVVASTALSAVLTFVRDQLAATLPVLAPFLPALDFAASFLVTSVLFAAIFEFVPDVDLGWRDVAVGAAFTALLFTIGKTLIGLYLGFSGATSIYGAAGSLVVLLLWVYYSAQLLLLGAEVTEVWTRRYGSRRPRAAAAPAPVA